jgi:hypothetical protein
MATLTSTKIKNTYDALLKSIDNDAIGTTAKQITDGLGNSTPLYVSTTQVGIGVTPEAGLNLHVFGDAKIGSNLTVIGNLVVEGSTTTVGTDTLTVKDPLIVLANNNTSTDAVDIGFYGKYTPSGTTLYSGLFREALTGKYRLFKGLEDEPTTTVNTSGTGYAKAGLVIGALEATTGTFSGQVTIPETPTADTHAASKGYVDSQITLQDLDFQGDSGTGQVDLDSQTLTIEGTTNEIETLASSQTLKIGLPNDVTISSQLIVGTSGSTDAPTIKAISASTAENILLEGTDTTAASAPDLVLYRNAGAVVDNDTLGVLEFRGRNNADTGVISYGGIYSRIIDASNQHSAITFSTNYSNTYTSGGMAFHSVGTNTPRVIIGNTDPFAIPTDTLDVDGTLNVSSTGSFGGQVTIPATPSANTDAASKGYVDSQVGANNELSEVLDNGNTTGGTDIAVSAGDDITFVDDSKAIFGTDGDLEIFHGSAIDTSFIQINGELDIRANTLSLKNYGGETYLRARSNAELRLYYDGFEKLRTTSTGVDITGAINADSATFTGDGDILSVNRGSFNVVTNLTSVNHNIVSTGKAFNIKTSDSNNLTFLTNNTTALTLDTSQNATFAGDVGIGVDPDYKLHVWDTGGGNVASFSNGVNADLDINLTSGVTTLTPTTGILAFGTSSTEKMRIDSSGNVGIGTDSPQGKLNVTAGIGTTGLELQRWHYSTTPDRWNLRLTQVVSGDDVAWDFKQTNNNTDYGSVLTLKNGNVGIGTTSPDYDLDVERTATAVNDNPTIRVRNAWNGEGNNTGFTNRALGLYSAGADTVVTRIQSRFDTGFNLGEIGTTTNHDFRFLTNSTERMRITSGGDVQLVGNKYLYANPSAGSTTIGAGFQLDAVNNIMKLWTNDTERMRITSGGTVGNTGSTVLGGGAAEGVTGWNFASGNGTIITSSDSDSNMYIGKVSGYSNDRFISFYVNNSLVGRITTNGSTTSYVTTSDYRAKENVVEMTGALDRVNQLKPKRFNFIADADTVDGFLAHEVQEIVPEAISGEKDGMRTEEYEVTPAVYEDVVHPAEEAVYETIEHPAVEEELDDEGNIIVEGKEAYTEEVLVTEAKEEWTEKVLVSEKVMGTREVPDYQGIDQSKLVPLLVGAIQEQQQLINDLKSRIETLENN